MAWTGMFLMERVLTKYHIQPTALFILAFDYASSQMPYEEVMRVFVSCAEQTGKGEYVLHTCPEEVETFCLDVLAKRVGIPKTLTYRRRAKRRNKE